MRNDCGRTALQLTLTPGDGDPDCTKDLDDRRFESQDQVPPTPLSLRSFEVERSRSRSRRTTNMRTRSWCLIDGDDGITVCRRGDGRGFEHTIHREGTATLTRRRRTTRSPVTRLDRVDSSDATLSEDSDAER